MNRQVCMNAIGVLLEVIGLKQHWQTIDNDDDNGGGGGGISSGDNNRNGKSCEEKAQN